MIHGMHAMLLYYRSRVERVTTFDIGGEEEEKDEAAAAAPGMEVRCFIYYLSKVPLSCDGIFRKNCIG